MDDQTKALLIENLYKIGAIKFGEFRLKSGDVSPIYIDLRETISHPQLLKQLADVVSPLVGSLDCSRLCGVPYGALPLASVVSVFADTPMVMCRTEAKEYGTKKRVEGQYADGESCLIIEDVATTGSSIIETTQVLRQHGLLVKDAIVIFDRQQGATKKLAEEGIALTSILELGDLLQRLPDDLDQSTRAAIDNYLRTNGPPAAQRLSWSLAERRDAVHHPVARRLIDIMLEKQSNLCVAADFTNCSSILELAGDIGSRICALKIHADIIQDFTVDFAMDLKKLAAESNFVIMEDRKFSDTGNTVALQTGGLHRLAAWADAFTVHGVSGPAVLKGLRAICAENGIGCFLVAQMSSEGNLIDERYEKGVLSMAVEFKDIVAGFICQKRFVQDNTFLFLSPGVSLGSSGDGLNQQWRSPEEAVCRDKVDVVIVGRGVIADGDKRAAAERYRESSWSALNNVQ